MTELLQKIGKMERKINIFNQTIMQGKIGVVRSIQVPSLEGNVFVQISFIYKIQVGLAI